MDITTACITIFVFLNSILSIHCELFTLGLTSWAVGSAIIGGGWLKWDTLKEKTYCQLAECCIPDYVPYDLNKLKKSLDDKLFGQPLVNDLIHIIAAHKLALMKGDKANRKALVISLHGWSGVGKNYAATLIAEALYKKGMNSQYVKLLIGSKDFVCSNVDKTKQDLIRIVRSIVKKCPASLIIFDEIHDMCPSVLDAIKPMLDHHEYVDDVDYRDSVFIFISNIGGQEIADNLLKLYSQGKKRSDVQFKDFESAIRQSAYYNGGFENSAMIAHHLIDYYVPFLPLEQNHIEKCALAEFRAHGIYHPSSEMMEEALSVITFGPDSQPIFANNGCKRFTKHIPFVIEKHRPMVEL